MDRIINVKVGGNHLIKDSKNAGVRGEANVTKLRITFDEGWDGYTKKITFWNARGLNPVCIILSGLAENETTYLVPIPNEPMEEAGMLTFVIEGTDDDKVQRSVRDELEVKDAPIAKNAGQPVPPTEDELTQLEGKIDEIKCDILEVKNAKEDTQKSAKSANEDAKTAESAMNSAKEYAEEAQDYSKKAQSTVGKTSYIGENGNWYAWDSEAGAFYDTLIKAQAGSMVYVGDNPPDDADVWINPDGNDVKEDIDTNSVNNTLIELKCFKPIAEDNGSKTITLDSVEGLHVGYQLVKAKYDDNGDFAGWQSRQISKINGNVVTLAGVFSYHPDYSTEYEPTIRNGVVFSDCLFDDNLNPIGTTDLQLEEDDYKYVHLEGLNNNGVITSLVSGVGNTAKSFDSIIIGAECETTAVEGVAIGNSCKAKFKRAVAIGSGASAEGLSSVALVGGKSTGHGAISIGSSCESSGQYSVSIGAHCRSKNICATTIGHFAEANGHSSFAHGSKTKANGQASDSGGYETEANGDFSISRGMSTKANGYLSYAGGYQTIATGTGAFAHGGGEKSGNFLEANGDYSFAIGWGGNANGKYSAVFNQDNIAEGKNSGAIGYGNIVNGEGSFCGGRFSVVNGENCFGFGTYLNVDGASIDTFVIGRWNDTSTKDFAFVVGNGTSTVQNSNAFTVDWNGNGVFSGDVRIKNSEGVVISLLNKIAELEERLAALESNVK